MSSRLVSPAGGAPGGPGRRRQRPLNPRTAFRIAVIGGITLAAVAVLVVRLWFMQVIDAQSYAQAAAANSIRTVIVPAPRGLITDRTGKVVLANDLPSINVVAFPLELTGPQRTTEMQMLAPVLHTGAAHLLAAMNNGEVSSPYEPVVLAEDISPIQQAVISERLRQFPGVALQSAYVRNYPLGTTAAHILGYTGLINQSEYKSYLAKGYVGNEEVGQAGLEYQYEQYLRGVPGQTEVEVDASGNPVSSAPLSSTPPVQGDTLQLSIDMPTQLALENELRERVQSSGTATGAAGVAIDPNSGQVLAMASYPTYIPNAFVQPSPANEKLVTQYASGTGAGSGDVLLNRAINPYPPGSTFKGVTSLSALELGILSPTELIDGPSEITLFNTVFPNFEKEDNGLLTLPTALEVSSDTYFYQVGDRFWHLHANVASQTGNANSGLQQQDWAERFGFGATTGLDLPGEQPGRVPTPAWKVAYFGALDEPSMETWLPGDNINMAVGQGNLLVTPLQLALAYAAIANGGSMVTPTLGMDVTNQSGQVVRQLSGVTPPRSLGLNPADLDVVRKGLYLVAQGGQGTASGVFSPVAAAGGPVVAGKTGTAQSGVNGAPDHSWFVGFAPFNNPKIVVAVIIEHGGVGATAAAPAVCGTIAAYGPTKFNPHLCGTPPPVKSN
jgi:penicillin-binding protein 2